MAEQRGLPVSVLVRAAVEELLARYRPHEGRYLRIYVGSPPPEEELPPDPQLPPWAELAYEAIERACEARGQAVTTREAYEEFRRVVGAGAPSYRRFGVVVKRLAELGLVERVTVSLGRYGKMAVVRPRGWRPPLAAASRGGGQTLAGVI